MIRKIACSRSRVRRHLCRALCSERRLECLDEKSLWPLYRVYVFAALGGVVECGETNDAFPVYMVMVVEVSSLVVAVHVLSPLALMDV